MFGKGKEKELNKDMVENGMSENNTKNKVKRNCLSLWK